MTPGALPAPLAVETALTARASVGARPAPLAARTRKCGRFQAATCSPAEVGEQAFARRPLCPRDGSERSRRPARTAAPGRGLLLGHDHRLDRGGRALDHLDHD